jgi:hypothetical protein
MDAKGHEAAVTVGEWSEWMPYRHEFDKEKDFTHDAEALVDSLRFDGHDTPEAFGEKIERLHAYNSVLSERQFRTRVVEEWDIPSIELREKKGGKGDEFEPIPPLLRGGSKEVRAIDQQLITLAPYLGRKNTEGLAWELQRRMHALGQIRSSIAWPAEGLTSLQDGKLFDWLKEQIAELARAREEPKTAIIDWNSRIDQYNERLIRKAAVEEETILESEKELCRGNAINAQMYLAMKNFLIREFTVTGVCRFDSFIRIVPTEWHRSLSTVHRFCIEKGWIAD